MENLSSLTSSLIHLSRELSCHAVGPEGNVSARLSDSEFLIKASGFSLGSVRDNNFVRCDLSGRKIDDSNLEPSIETPLHAWLYSTYGFKYIAHTHPTNTLKILCSESASDFAKARLFPDHVVFNGAESCLVEYATPGEDLLSYMKLRVKKHYTVPRLILLKNHGVIAVGETTKDCIQITQICEKAADIYIGSKSLGLVCLSQEQKKKIESDKKEIYRRSLQ